MSDIGNRIKKERERLGFSQPRLADIVEVSKRTIIEWEKSATSPNAVQLSALSDIGVDVTYLITGSRSLTSGLTPEESHLLENYRHATAEQQRSISQVSEAFAAYKVTKKPSPWHRSANHTPVVFFSGFTKGEGHYMEDIARQEGLRISTAGRVTRLTDWAVLSDDASTHDRKAALDLGIPVLSREDFYEMAKKDDGDDRLGCA